MNKTMVKAALALSGLVWLLGAGAAELRVLSAGAVKAPVSELLARFTQTSGHTVLVDYAPIGVLQQKLAAGERPDLVIATSEAMDDFQQKAYAAAAGRVALGSTGIGVAVRQGAPLPDISTVAAFRQALLDTPSLVYVDPTRGTSGKHFAQVLQQLGIADAIKAKTTLLDGGYVVEPVGKGQIAMGVHQITEILPVPGVQLVGPLPDALQKLSTYVAAAGAHAAQPQEAAQLMRFLSDAQARGVFAAKGFSAPVAP